METGNNISASLIKKEFQLLPDNQQDLVGNDQKSFVDISRNRLLVLRLNSKFKAVAFSVFKFPYCLDNERWCSFLRHILNSEDFKETAEGSELFYSNWDSKATLVPSALHNEKYGKVAYEVLFGENPGVDVKSQVVPAQNSIGVYAIASEIERIVSKPIANSYLHWLNSLSNSSGTVLNVVVNENEFGLLIQKNDSLLFSNWFEIKKTEDILYFIMATLESLNILHSDVQIVLSGDVEKNDSTYSTISKFISKISFGNRPKNLEYAYSFKELPNHKFPFIFSTACA